MTTDTFAGLGLAEPLLRALAAAQFNTPTPIQARAIPSLLAGRDLLGIAQTGTGKTAAFGLPLLQKLSQDKAGRAEPRTARALILAPTRELAIQISEALTILGRNLGLRHTVIMGGVGQHPQVKAMARGIDLLVATPGRLLDLVNQRHIRLDQTRFLVLDEADRMLDMGFIRDVRKIVATMPKQRHSLLFSATMPSDVAKLAAEMLKDPLRVEVSPETLTVDLIDQRVFFVPTADKRALLVKMLGDPKLSRVIVFTRTKHGANRVVKQLAQSGIPADAIHGNKSQGARQRALELFRGGRTRVLVATDIAARGIDVTDISHVINFELPNEPESYVHRIGRTARNGAAGIAISFCDATERAYLRDIERLIKQRVAVAEGSAPAPEPRQPIRQGARPQGGGSRKGAPNGGLRPSGPRHADQGGQAGPKRNRRRGSRQRRAA